MNLSFLIAYIIGLIIAYFFAPLRWHKNKPEIIIGISLLSWLGVYIIIVRWLIIKAANPVESY